MTDTKKLFARVERILEIARVMAEKKDKELGTYQVSDHIDGIQIYTESSEPGDDDCIYIVANWNNVDVYDRASNSRVVISDLPSRLCNIFEKMGVNVEWSDEVSSCSDCGKMIRTSPDSYSWQPNFVVGDGEILCCVCISNDPEKHLEDLEGDPNRCNTIESINPADHGYVCAQERLESGWHSGQTADPKKIAKELQEKGITRFLFNLDENSQFYSTWSVFIAKEEMPIFNGEQEEDSSSCPHCGSKDLQDTPNGTCCIECGVNVDEYEENEDE
jgi:hypothetical protein